MKALLALPLAVFIAASAQAQSRAPFSLVLAPSAQLPQGARMRELYSLGYGADLEGELAVPGAGSLAASASLGFLGIPIIGTEKSLSILSLGAGPSIGLRLFDRLDLKLAAQGGYAVLFGPSESAGNPFASASLRATFPLSPTLALGLSSSYRLHFNATGLDYQGLAIGLGASFGLGGGVAPKMRILELRLDPIFPVFYKYYETNAAGSLRVRNDESGPVSDLVVSFFMPQFMAGPKRCAVIDRLKAGEEREVPITALFTDSIISITEDTKIGAKVSVAYSYLGAHAEKTDEVSLRIYNRNAMIWDDDRRAAAFVSAKDPSVLTFSKTAAGIAREGSIVASADFRQAMGIFQALGAYGIRYVPDPTSPFTDSAKGRTSVDYLQFPAQTLAYKAGDCDDLSICYAAMLEATGTPAAFITVPGHIYVAFGLGMDLAAAKSSFSSPGDLIFRDGSAWLPVEITMLREGFLAAWKAGAKQWREAGSGAAMFPIREAWDRYEPAAFVGGERSSPFPSADALSAAFSDEIGRFVADEIKGREAAYRAELAASQGDPRLLNKLGLLYARYGLYDKAETEFSKATGYMPAMVNLGNIALERRDAVKATELFNRALAKDGISVPALIGLARARYAAGASDEALSLYERLRALDPKTAQRYSYLGAAGSAEARGRAGQADGAPPLWAESD